MNDPLIELEGRIAAQEQLMRGVLAVLMHSTPGDPLENLEADRRVFLLSLKQTERPKDSRGGAVWDAALAAVQFQLDQVALRLKDDLDAGPTQ